MTTTKCFRKMEVKMERGAEIIPEYVNISTVVVLKKIVQIEVGLGRFSSNIPRRNKNTESNPIRQKKC